MTHSERTANQFPLLLQPANPSNEGCSFSSRGSLGRSHRRQKGPRYFPAGSHHNLRNKRGKQLHRLSRSHLVIPTKNCAIRQASLMQPDNSFISFCPLYLIPTYHSGRHFSLWFLGTDDRFLTTTAFFVPSSRDICHVVRLEPSGNTSGSSQIIWSPFPNICIPGVAHRPGWVPLALNEGGNVATPAAPICSGLRLGGNGKWTGCASGN